MKMLEPDWFVTKCSMVRNMLGLFVAFTAVLQCGYNCVTLNMVEGELIAFLETTPYMQSYSKANMEIRKRKLSSISPANLSEMMNEQMEEKQGHIDNAIAFMNGGFMVLGTLSSCYFAQKMEEKHGTRKTFSFATILSLVGCVLILLCKSINNFWILVGGHLLKGIACGLYSYSAILYTAQLCIPRLKATIGSVTQVFQCFGFILSMVLGLNTVLGTRHNWYTTLAIPLLVNVPQLIAIKFMPEIPKVHETWNQQKKKNSNLNLTKRNKSWINKREIVCVLLQITRQFSGMLTLMYYSATFLKRAGLSREHAEYTSLGMIAMMTIGNLASALVITKKRIMKLYLVGTCGMILTLATIILTMIYEHGLGFSKFANSEEVDGDVISKPIALSNSSIIIMVSTFVFSICFGMGPGPIPWLAPTIIMEPEKVAKGNSISNFTNWLGSFIIAFLFPYWRRNVYDSLAFTPFLATLLILTIPVYWLYPSEKSDDDEDAEKHGKERTDIFLEISLRERAKDHKIEEAIEAINLPTDAYSIADENENTKYSFSQENTPNHKLVNRFKVEKVEQEKEDTEEIPAAVNEGCNQFSEAINAKDLNTGLVLDTKIKIEDKKLAHHDSTLTLELVVQI